MKRVLVTGAGGFIGRHMLEPLTRAGYEVHAVTRRQPAAQTPGVQWVVEDLLSGGAAGRLIKRVKPTHLVHLAWITTHGLYWTSPENDRWLSSTRELLEAFASSGGQRLFAAGTCAEYDWSGDGTMIEGVTPLLPHTPYGKAKVAAWQFLESMLGSPGFSAAWGRVFFPYGPHESPARLIPSTILSILHGQPARCTSGKQERDFLYIQDAAAAIVAVLESKLEGAVNIASGQAVAVSQIVRKIGDLLGRPELVQLGTIPDRPDDCPRLVGDVTRLRQIAQWQPAFTLDQGLARTIEWWRNHRPA